MNTRQYYYLITVADSSNLSQAASALGLTPSALSKFLTSLESLIGGTLFIRTPALSLTPLGQKALAAARNILDEQNRMLLTIRSLTGGIQKKIRLATSPNRGAIIYSRIYQPFSRRYPDTALELTELYSQEQAKAIRRSQIDLALGNGEFSTQVTDLPFAREEVLAVLPRSHPLSRENAVRLTELRDTPFVLQSAENSLRHRADTLFAEAGYLPVVVFESGDVHLLDAMMQQGAGAGLVSRVYADPCEQLAYLSLIPPAYQTLHLRYPLGHTLSEAERFLASLLIRERLSDPRYEALPSPEIASLLADTAPGRPSVPPLSACTPSPSASGSVYFDTKVLEYLIGIVEEKSLSGAAQRFYLAQPALSRHLKKTETQIGVSLFTREHNRLRPTPAGTVLINSARNIIKQERELFRSLS